MRGSRFVLPALLAAVSVACGSTASQPKLLGQACAPQIEKTEECADGICAAVDSASGFCTRLCDDSEACGEGFSCEQTGLFGRVCVKLQGCRVEGDCPAGHSCNPETANCYIKVSRTLCSPCQDVLQCPEGGSCLTAISTGERFCTSPCETAGDCPLGFLCSEQLHQCVPEANTCNAGKPLCAPCGGDGECGGEFDLCVRNVVSEEMFCGRVCHPDHPDCPQGFSCADLGDTADDTTGPYQCVPVSNTCASYCDSANEQQENRQCGFGRQCDLGVFACSPARDGRECAPCLDHDDCRPGPNPPHPENRCIVNDCEDCPFRGEAFCATPCLDDAACVRSFGLGFVCKPVQEDTGTRSYCMPQRGTCASGLGRLGDPCEKKGAGDCLAGVCLVAGSVSFCSQPCAQDADCGDLRYHCCEAGETGYDCSAAQRQGNGPKSGQGVCAPLGGLFGDDCRPGRPPCQTGTCLDLGTARVCTVPCAAGCPEGFACRTARLPDNEETREICFPEGGGLPGADCTFGPAACESGLCIRKNSGSRCTRACTADAECPERWSCAPAETGDQQSLVACLPPDLQ